MFCDLQTLFMLTLISKLNYINEFLILHIFFTKTDFFLGLNKFLLLSIAELYVFNLIFLFIIIIIFIYFYFIIGKAFY